MLPQEYKVIANHAHEVLECIILYIILHAISPNLGGMNCHMKNRMLLDPDIKIKIPQF